MSKGNLPIILIMALVASFIGQMFGLGGGFIYCPILLSMGVNPLVVSSTALYLIIFSSGQSMIMFMLFGKVNYMYLAWLALFTGTGVFLGLFSVKALMRKYKRPSLVAFALAVAIIISTLFSIFPEYPPIAASLVGETKTRTLILFLLNEASSYRVDQKNFPC